MNPPCFWFELDAPLRRGVPVLQDHCMLLHVLVGASLRGLQVYVVGAGGGAKPKTEFESALVSQKFINLMQIKKKNLLST